MYVCYLIVELGGEKIEQTDHADEFISAVFSVCINDRIIRITRATGLNGR